MVEEYEARYSGPNRSGTCICGHSWEHHHLGLVMRQSYVDATGEGYIPGECLHYGFNEEGGLMPDPEGGPYWVNHCHGYIDSKA